MRIRQKTLLLISTLLVSLIAVLYGSLSAILGGSFAELEEKDTERNVQRVKEALYEEIEQLSVSVYDYAAWDDTYDYVIGENPEYPEVNLIEESFAGLKINAIALLDNNAKVIFGTGFNRESEEKTELPPGLKNQFTKGNPLVTHANDESEVTGILMLKDKAILVASQPILTSEGTGPGRGTFLLGRFLDGDRIEALSTRTKLELKFYPLGAAAPLDETLTTITERLTASDDGIEIRPVDGDTIHGYGLIRDLNGQPALLLKVIIPRDIHQQGQKSLFYLVVSLSGVGIIFGVVILIVLEKFILKRVTNLSAEVETIGSQNNLALRVKESGKDEISALASSINIMLEQIEVGAKQLAVEQEKAERLLLNILPEPIAEQLKHSQDAIAEHFDEVTILFADIVGFTPLSAKLGPIELVNLLNRVFSTFDHYAERLGLEKIKTIGDAYMVAAGLPLPRRDHAEAIAEMALAMQQAVTELQNELNEDVKIRIGINTGVVVAGVIGTRKFIYDLWGDSVNVASRMESSGEPGSIQVTASTYELLRKKYVLKHRGQVKVKGKGEMDTYWLLGRKRQTKARVRVKAGLAATRR
ncbi:adenylate/guanylate cyclase with integral membrane sensor [[Leptolyngbya] sp. PCC 7376]|uniref:adenylate/guanylate cyclase domain-containing protein n=1 Tax=[Leptolyngbya] sp. PCC 7376 TaxID=111781 RepID=UPI00029EDE4D|nr:adenylate/guanylate cyclase domain-containing protein [[Leptolyngbya] sp. PCC 7376]AFY39059.1 adenylate/guanylate cyclase with integral membrane sensor [[Leptolyngbya] sp. PCC 7376]